VVALLFALCLACTAAGVGDGYKSPQVMVPYAFTKPTMDGVVGDSEWQGAASINALRTVNGQVSPRQVTFYLMWDEDNIFWAMRSPMRKGERVIQEIREQDKDVNCVFDDSYELWFDVGAKSPDGQPVYFQFLSNFAGARYDVMQEPAVGNSRVSWTSGWIPKSRITADGTWECEVAVSRKAMYKDTPFAEGFKFSSLMSRNFKRPWEQNTVEGLGVFSTRESYTACVLSKEAPAVHLTGVADTASQTLGLALGAWSKNDQSVRWSFESDGGVSKSGVLDVNAGKTVSLPAMLDLDKPGDGYYRIKVTSVGGDKTYLDWCSARKFGDMSSLSQQMKDTGDRVNLALTFNPVGGYLRARGDFIDYDNRAVIDRCLVSVNNAAGKEIASTELKIDSLAYVQGVIKLGDIPNGDYVTRLRALDSTGKEVLVRDSNFSKKDASKEFPWWNTKHGNIERVVSPWTPVTYKNGQIGVWGRTMRSGAAGLPAAITTQGVNVLARPAEIVLKGADGVTKKAALGKTAATLKADHRVTLTNKTKLGNLDLSSVVTAEFDGMYKVDLTVTPKKATQVGSLQVVIPINEDLAQYFHVSGEGIRYGFDYGFIDKAKTGRLWDSRKIDGQHMTVGSFVPFIWIGCTKGGLSWFADNDQGWAPNDDVPAIEIRRDGKSVDLVLNLISKPFTIDSPRHITFGFEATPIKPMHKGWRMDTWWCGDTFFDFAQVQPRGGDIIWTSMPAPLDKAASKALVDSFHASGKNAVPYFENNSMGGFGPEPGYFGEQWKSSVNGALWFEKTLSDYMIYSLYNWAKDCDIDGFYVDNIRPEPCANIEAGRGYLLPDGRVQPTYQIFDVRKYYLRMRAAFIEAGKTEPKIVLHMTNNMVIPWIGAADMAYDGEHNVLYPEMGKDFMDAWSLDRMRLDFPAQWGTPINFMNEYQGNWDKDKLAKAYRAYRGMVILHDALPTGNAPWWMFPDFAKARKDFGIDADDVRFIGYWQSGSGLSADAQAVKLAGWVRPGKVLVAVVNRGEAGKVTLSVDGKKLGLPAASTWQVIDGETGETFSANASGKITLPVERHDYRQIVISGK
jgi:hypothetical protein